MKKLKWLSALLMSLLLVLCMVCSAAVGEAGSDAEVDKSITADDVSPEIVIDVAKEDLIYSGKPQEIAIVTIGNPAENTTVTCEGAEVVETEDGWTVSAVNADNYTIAVKSGEKEASATVTVKKLTVTITPDNAEMNFGEEIPAFTAKVDPPVDVKYSVNSENLSELPSAGEYKLIVAVVREDYPNYDIKPAEGELTVHAATGAKITVTAGSTSLTYGEKLDYSAAVDGAVEGCDLVYTLVVKDSDGNNVSDAMLDVGEYTVKVELGENPNYDKIECNTVAVTVAPRAVEVNVTDTERIYGEANPELFTVTYSEGKEPVDGESLSFGIVADADMTSAVGEYDIVLTLNESDVHANYDIAINNGTLKVNPRPATVTVKDSERYYGSDDPKFEVTYSDNALVNGDELAFEIAADATAESAVGEYDIVLTLAEDSEVNANYDITVVNGTLKVNPRPISVNVVDAERYYYAANPEFGVTYTAGEALGSEPALVNGDVLDFEIAACENEETLVGEETAVGEYDIVLTLTEGSEVNANYAITVNDGKLNIVYLKAEPLAFKTEPAEGCNGWYNEVNPAIVEVPEGYAFVTTSELATVNEDVVEFADASEGVVSYCLEDTTTHARTEQMSLAYKQDTVAPVIELDAKGDSKVYVQAYDERSGLTAALLLDGAGKTVRDLMSDAVKVEDVLTVDYSEIVKVVCTLMAEATDEAGNTADTDENRTFASDGDGDGLNYVFESMAGTQSSTDFDNDGLDDYFEEMSGFSDRTKADTDGDGISDEDEFLKGLKARHADSDYDGISDSMYLRYLNALGLNGLDLELSMLLLQSNLLQANNQATVAAGELTLLADEYFQMDNGEEAGYTVVKSDMGKADQLSRYKQNYYMLRFDARDGKAVYLTTSYNGTYYLVQASVKGASLKVSAAYELPYDKNAGNLAVSTSADGSVVVLAAWADGAATENLLLVNMNTGEQFRFGSEANTVGATRFALSNDGTVLAYVDADNVLHTINMTETDYQDAEYTGNALYFTADGQLEINVDASSTNGVYHVAQPTLEGVSLVMVDNGKIEEIAINGRFYFNNYVLYCRVENLRQSEGVRVNTLYKKLNAAK